MKNSTQLLLQLLTLFWCLVFANTAFADKITVNSQAEWNAVSLPLLPGDSICITELAVGPNAITSTTGMASIQGTIVNAGDFTMNNSGVSIVMSGKILNLGTFTVGNVGLSVEGIFENVGVLNVSGAAVVIQSSGSLLNTGTINNNVNITINGSGSLLSCNSVAGSGSISGGSASGNPPVGTACDDNDDTTTDDVITDVNCSCAGVPIQVAAAPVPIMNRLGMLLMGLTILGVSIWGLRQSTMT